MRYKSFESSLEQLITVCLKAEMGVLQGLFFKKQADFARGNAGMTITVTEEGSDFLGEVENFFTLWSQHKGNDLQSSNTWRR